ncbi:hypothetical protein V5J35_003781 [Endozoicomonas sp. NE40]|uniref:Uncharacterized protein n=1 Tax=Endozoicomonas lisbonensis TaxID=3120522 RepID=A0ABV2SLD9_9GAMM
MNDCPGWSGFILTGWTEPGLQANSLFFSFLMTFSCEELFSSVSLNSKTMLSIHGCLFLNKGCGAEAVEQVVEKTLSTTTFPHPFITPFYIIHFIHCLTESG